MRTDLGLSTWGGCWWTLCGSRHSLEDPSRRIMVAYSASGFEITLPSLSRMSMDGETIAEI